MSDIKKMKTGKLWLIIAVAVVALGVIVSAVFGINLGKDFSKKAVLTVNLDSYAAIDANRAKIEDSVEKVIKENGLSFVTYRYAATGNKDVRLEYTFNIKSGLIGMTEQDLLVKLRGESDETVDGLRASIETMLKADYSELGTIETNAFVSEANSDSQLIWRSFLAFGLAIIITYLYVLLRYNTKASLVYLIALACNLLLTLSLTSITRLAVNTSFLTILSAVVALSALLTVMLLERVKENGKALAFKGKDQSEMIESAYSSTIMRIIMTAACILLAAVAMAIIGTSILREAVIALMLAAIACAYTAYALTAPFFIEIVGKKTAAAAKENK